MRRGIIGHFEERHVSKSPPLLLAFRYVKARASIMPLISFAVLLISPLIFFFFNSGPDLSSRYFLEYSRAAVMDAFHVSRRI
jgi:hypothetical protein